MIYTFTADGSLRSNVFFVVVFCPNVLASTSITDNYNTSVKIRICTIELTLSCRTNRYYEMMAVVLVDPIFTGHLACCPLGVVYTCRKGPKHSGAYCTAPVT